ncbi:interaptin-like isoform X1 [Mytilus edulis]|uniref:interaptin-like isoform X1 n=1 Tax=Mytilus edulis TaxID=6550 RepID=UPI0039F12874
MSVLQVYLNWANSVLADIDKEVEGISSIQEGQVLCQLIDLLCPEACLLQKLQASGTSQLPEMYIQTALDHMRKYGIKLNFSSQDIADGDIKSMLDVLWLIILNYGIHNISAYCDDFNTRRNAHQRSVGIGKKLLLEWCQRQLDTDFDSRNTLTYNLCTGDWFIKLLKKYSSVSAIASEDKAEQLKILLDSIEKQYSIKSSIINASDIVDGTVDEHTLMIFVSLLQRKVDGSSLIDEGSSRSDSRKNPSDETSDWFSTSNGSGSDPQFSRLPVESESILTKTISDTISDRFHEEDKLSALSGSTYDSRDRTLERESSPHSRHINGSYEPKRESKLTSDTVRSTSPLRRPRDHKAIMAEAKEKLEEQRRRREDEDQKVRENEQKLFKETEAKKVDTSLKHDSVRSSHDDIEEVMRENLPQYSTGPPQYLPGLGRGVPIFVVPGQNPETMFLLQALRQARHEANFHDQDSSSKSSSEETLPKASLLDLETVDDIPPSEYLQFESDKKAEMSTPRGVSPRRSNYVPSPEFLPTKKSIIDVLGNPPDPQTNVVEFPPAEKDDRRHFPRVEIKEDVKVRREMGRDQSDERLSPRRDNSNRPLSPGYDFIDETVSINDKDTVPKTILKKSSNYGTSSRDSSYERTRDRSQSPRSSEHESGLRSRSPRDQMERDRSLSNDRTPSGRSLSPRSNRSPRHRSPDLDRLTDNYDRIQSGNQHRETAPGSNSDSVDPNTRLVKVFHQELDLLRMKMEMLEKSHLPDDGDLEDLNSLTQRLSEKIKERLSSRSPRSPRSPRHRSTSPDYTRGRLFRKNDVESRSLSENRVSPSSDWRTLPSEKSNSLHNLPVSIDKSLKVDDDGKLLYSPRSQGKPITLGYSSPIRKVSDEIWGMREEEFAGVTNVQKEKWKKLTSARDISDSDIVELKHALGTVVAENDILQAKLRNSNTDIQEKMRKTGEVLNDCRCHLSKAQAENMELRTQLEKERNRNESLEARMREFEKQVKDLKGVNSELESELEDTRKLLKGSSKKDIPTMQSLAEERDGLVEVLGTTQTENERLREELERAQKYAFKAQTTIVDLKTIVDDARKERQQLFEEITRLQSEGHLQTITGIIKKYMDKGIYLEVEPMNGFKIPSRTASPTPNERRCSPVPKQRLSRSVDSVIAPRSRSKSPRTETPTKHETENIGTKSWSMSAQQQTYSGLSRSYQEPTPSQRSYQDPAQRSYQQSNQRSYSPARHSYKEPVMASSPLKTPYGRVNGLSIPITPVVNDIISDDDDDDDFEDEGIEGFHYNYEDISPSVTSNLKEIYPHRRTRSYRNNFSSSFDEGRVSPSVDDIEVNRILSRHPVRLDFNDTADSYRSRSPRREDNFNVSYERSKSPGRLDIADLYEMKQPVRQQNYNIYGNTNRRPVTRSESPSNRYTDQKNYNGKSGEINNRLFMAALDNAVHEEGSKKYYDDHDIPEKDSWRDRRDRLSSSYGPEVSRAARTGVRSNGVKGILKNTKGEQNYMIKHGTSSPLHRSVLERSVSPSAKTPPNNRDINKNYSKLANSSLANNKTFGNSGKPSLAPASSGKPLFSGASKKSGIVRNPKDLFADISLSPVRTASPSKYQHTPLDSPTPQLTEEEKRYADLLVDKYTKQLGFNTIYS